MAGNPRKRTRDPVPLLDDCMSGPRQGGWGVTTGAPQQEQGRPGRHAPAPRARQLQGKSNGHLPAGRGQAAAARAGVRTGAAAPWPTTVTRRASRVRGFFCTVAERRVASPGGPSREVFKRWGVSGVAIRAPAPAARMTHRTRENRSSPMQTKS